MKGPPMQPVHHAKGNFDMTKDEFKRIEKAMNKPEFMGMLKDYMDEISDPKNKDEYDEYLRQLQKDGDLPKELKLVKPQPGFCIKTTISSKKDKGSSQKLFINCCHTYIVQIPSFDMVERNGKRGQNWRLPYSAGKMRYDQTSKKEVCTTIDVAFHPHAFQLCQSNPQFQELVCSTALDAANQQMGERNEIISKDYKVLKNTKCKGGEPALLTVRISGTVGDHIKQMQEKMGQQDQQQQQQQGQSEMQKRQNGEGYEPSLYKDILNQKKEYDEEQLKKREEQRRIEEAEEVIVEDVEVTDGKSQPIQAPKYKIVYSYPVNYEDFLDRREESHLKRPIGFTVEVSLPRATGIKEITLDIEEKNLVLNVKDKYFLDIKLPYSVIPDDGNASFDNKKKLLKIKLPIDKSKIPEDPKPPKTYKEFEDTTAGEDNDEESNKENNQTNNVDKLSTQADTQSETKSVLNDSTAETNNLSQNEPLLELKNKNPVSVNILNQQTKESFIEQTELINPVIEELSSKDNETKQQQINDDDDDEDDENTEQDKVQKQSKKLEYKEEIIVKSTTLLTYKVQQTTDKTFIIFNIPSYSVENLKTVIFDGKLFISYEDKRSIRYLRVDIKQDFDMFKSNISTVTDYIVFNLQKSTEGYWADDEITATSDDFETFKLLLDEMTQARKLYEESQLIPANNKLQKKDNNDQDDEEEQEIQLEKQENKKETNMDDLDGLDGETETETASTATAEKVEEKKDKQIEFDNKDDTQVIKLNEDGVSKIILQFIEFNDTPLIYELD